MSIQKITDYPMPKRSTYVENKTNWKVDPDRSVLLLHDMQRYFLQFYDPNGSLMSELINNLIRVREWARQNAVPVVYTAQPYEQTPEKRMLLNDMWGLGLTASSPEQQRIIDQLKPEANDTVFDKWRYSAFQRTNLQTQMKNWNRDQLLIGGVYAHIGCMVTAIDAFMNDFQAFLIGDAVADFSIQEHLYALKYVATRCGHVIDTEHLLGIETKAITRQWLNAWVRKLVDEDGDLEPNENLIFYGIDSLKIMQLSSELKSRGIDIGFEELGRAPTLSNWWSLVQSRQPVDQA